MKKPGVLTVMTGGVRQSTASRAAVAWRNIVGGIVIAHSAIDFRKVFSERIATYLRDGMTLHTGIHTTFRRAG